MTCNVDDFVGFARAREVHAGLVLIEEGDLSRGDQLKAVRCAVVAMEGKPDMANRALRIWLDGKTAFEEIPPPA